MDNTNIIEQVNITDWEFTDSDTQYLTHNIHRYSGKFIPQIARRAIELLTDSGDVVLDSYMGSGTALLEAQLIGRSAVGIDLNPLAVLISKVKNTPINNSDLIELHERLIPFVNMLLSDGQMSFVDMIVGRDCCSEELKKMNGVEPTLGI